MRGSINYKLVNTDNPIFEPTRKHPNDGGADLRARIESSILLHPERCLKIPTGVAVEIPEGFVGLVQPRSGASIEGKVAITGTIDSDYRGEISMNIYNLTDRTLIIEPEERLAQLVVVPCLIASFFRVSELSETDRGENGFGSTGRF